MEKKWFVFKNQQQMGPYRQEDVISYIRTGRISREDMVWNQELSGWTRAGEISELFPSTPANPPSTSSSAPTPATSPSPSPPQAHPVPGKAPGAAFSGTSSPPPSLAQDNYRIEGGNFPVVELTLTPGTSYYAETGAMAWMTSNIKMNTQMRGGLLKGLGRKFMGESLFLCSFSCENGTGKVAFAPDFAGVIKALKLKPGEAYICQRNSFLAAQDTVDLSLELKRKLGAGFFGGEGFILQRLTGPGTAFVEIDGSAIERILAPGETLQVATGFVAMYESTVSMNITRVKGVSNLLFGNEGVFLTTLTGPGKVWLQTMPFAQLAGKIVATIPSSRS